jgi:chemotaxis protein MotB
MAIARRRHALHEEEESYFVSMTDIMVGLLFLFIIMLMFFALKFQQATTNLSTANDTRTGILKQVAEALDKQGIPVEIDIENGILRLPEQILFERSKADLSPKGREAVGHLARALGAVVPCYAKLKDREPPASCPATPHSIEAIFVEGHTDTDGTEDFNWRLSAQRALNTFQALVHENPDLKLLQNRRSGSEQAILSIAGYGRERPVAANDTDDNKRKNRRIDLRFIMLTPRASAMEQIDDDVENGVRR